MRQIKGIVADVVNRCFIPAELCIEGGVIVDIVKKNDVSGPFILPGLVDAHVHIESSMLVPSEFARAAVVHGTVATVSDPHEIANVLGVDGVDFMIDNGNKVPFKFYFGAPSCVPATGFESSGAVIGPAEVSELLSRPEILYLSEMMNFPGVIHGDADVKAKLKAAKDAGKPIDGHAPGLRAEGLASYAGAGITTDHECFTLEEAREKVLHGIKVLIREGSAARNFETLIPLLREAPDMVMFCSDDKHPDDLMLGHINLLLKRSVASGYDVFDAIRACTLNPREHYGLSTGLLRPGDAADFILVDNLRDFNVLETYIDGVKVASKGECLIPRVGFEVVNRFDANKLSTGSIEVEAAASSSIRVIEAYDGQLLTGELHEQARIEDGNACPDPDHDILKIVVYNRYRPSLPAVGFIRGFGLRDCAIASTVAHDSHNLIAVGTNDLFLVKAINSLIDTRGGICFYSESVKEILPLPVAGLMSTLEAHEVATLYKNIDMLAKANGSKLKAPFMTLSFMALLVIPSLKLSDMGLFDGQNFHFTPLYVD